MWRRLDVNTMVSSGILLCHPLALSSTLRTAEIGCNRRALLRPCKHYPELATVPSKPRRLLLRATYSQTRSLKVAGQVDVSSCPDLSRNVIVPSCPPGKIPDIFHKGRPVQYDKNLRVWTHYVGCGNVLFFSYRDPFHRPLSPQLLMKG